MVGKSVTELVIVLGLITKFMFHRMRDFAGDVVFELKNRKR